MISIDKFTLRPGCSWSCASLEDLGETPFFIGEDGYKRFEVQGVGLFKEVGRVIGDDGETTEWFFKSLEGKHYLRVQNHHIPGSISSCRPLSLVT
jgi:hypothetical protein